MTEFGNFLFFVSLEVLRYDKASIVHSDSLRLVSG
jgi:hypothetical protein